MSSHSGGEGRRPATPDSGATEHRKVVERYLDGFRNTDRELILSCLTEDVEWEIPGAFHVRGKSAFAEHIVDPGFEGKPAITVTRWIEQGAVIVAEGSVKAPRTDGSVLNVVFCDVFEMLGGKIRRLISYLMATEQREDVSAHSKSEPRLLADDLEALGRGTLAPEQFRARHASAHTSSIAAQLRGNWEHYLADADVRQRDAEYRGMQQRELKKLVHLLRQGAPVAQLLKVHFLGPSAE